MRTPWLLVCLLVASQVRANVKAVFAHFMVGNTGSYSIADWQDDISKAAAAHIDGFALNMAVNDSTNGASLGNAFTAANNLGSGFKLFFSFDYAGNGLWDKAQVIALINQYSSNPAYYHRGSQPLVSTFEGPAASPDWPSIKSATGCFFIPSWSSLGAGPAWALGTADGLFSWAAWPDGPNEMSTFTDHSYLDALSGHPYMMAVSPWFFTNMPGYRKNWLWRGDSLWFDRWVHVMSLQPEYVEIISWNDYGESHHIGPLRDNAYVAFDNAHGEAPFNYALGKSHDGWRTFLPFLIDMAKSNTSSFAQENLVAWYRENPNSACGTGGTTGNTAGQLQQVYAPGLLSQDMVFYTALLGSSASVSVSIGGASVAGTWTVAPSGNGAGLYRGSVSVSGRTGTVIVTITRSGSQILQASGDPITTTCTNSIENWNANVITGSGHSISSASPLSLANSGCTSGFGDPKYLDLCSFACQYDYCPAVCTCTSLGTPVAKPVAKNVNGCPAPGMDSTYLGLCSFSCNYGYCPNVCQLYPAGHVCTAPNPQAPPIPVCVSGTADGPYADLCSFSCYYGFCPPQICTCTQAGSSTPNPPPQTDMVGGSSGAAPDYGLCQWTCQHGNCPSDLCTCSGIGCSGQGPVIGTFASPSRLAITQAASASGSQLGQACRLALYCTDQTDVFVSSCYTNEVKLGWDKDGCSGANMGRSICCPSSTAVTTCTWRGSGGDCNGQCHPGEVQVRGSSWGGGPGTGGVGRCSRGIKAFCCQSLEYSLDTYGCRWSGCWGSCDAHTEEAVLLKTNTGLCKTYSNYCCPQPALLNMCVWRGTFPDCADAKCKEDEVAVELSRWGDTTSNSCWWGRQRIACCKLNALPPPLPETCDYDWCSAFPEECAEEQDDAMGFGDVPWFGAGLGGVSPMGAEVVKRGNPRRLPCGDEFNLLPFRSNRYPSRKDYILAVLKRAGSIVWWGVSSLCDSTEITQNTGTDESTMPKDLDTEHPLDLQLLMRFAEKCVSGIVPDGTKSVYATIPESYFNNIFIQDNMLPAGLSRVSPTSPEIRNPMKRVFEAFGSSSNYGPLLLADSQMNRIKGALIGLKEPQSTKTLTNLIYESISGDTEAGLQWISYIRKSISVFKYLQRPEVKAALSLASSSVRTQLALVESNTLGASNLANHWDEFIASQLDQMQLFSRQWITDQIIAALRLYDNLRPKDYAEKVYLLQTFIAEVGNMFV